MLQQGQALRHKEVVTSDADDVDSSDNETMIHESTTRKTTIEDMEADFSEDEQVLEDVAENDSDAGAGHPWEANSGRTKHREAAGKLQINPSQYLVVESQGQRSATTCGDESSEVKVALAFAGDDDVVAEFAAEKKKTIERERPKNIDMCLPGWGEWAGPGIKPSRHRKKR